MKIKLFLFLSSLLLYVLSDEVELVNTGLSSSYTDGDL